MKTLREKNIKIKLMINHLPVFLSPDTPPSFGASSQSYCFCLMQLKEPGRHFKVFIPDGNIVVELVLHVR